MSSEDELWGKVVKSWGRSSQEEGGADLSVRLSDPKALCLRGGEREGEGPPDSLSLGAQGVPGLGGMATHPQCGKQGSQSPLSLLPQVVPVMAEWWEQRGLGEVEKEARGS